ncbi:hypothetical protein E3P92_01023 [Wallemia ichthyophaga]|nr:hypothetical protein E3P92_01023 [Wallemia ichthyophaga]
MAVKRAGYETIPAYAKLQFKQEDYAYYLQCLSINIGRRCAIAATKTAATTATTSPNSPPPAVDVDLGASKSISRLHASISYDFETQLFNLNVHSNNGLWVDGLWYGRGARIELARRVKIQIATKVFWFIMPAEHDMIATSTKQPSKKAAKAGGMGVGGAASGAGAAPAPAPTTSKSNTHTPSNIPTHPQATHLTLNNNLRPNVAYTTLINAELHDAGVKLSAGEICERLMHKYEWFSQNRDSGWQTAILLHLASGKQYHKMEASANQYTTKWTTTHIFETWLANKALSPRSIQLSIAANKTQPSHAKNDVAKAAKAMATQSTAAISSLAPDMHVNMKVQNLKQPQMPITMNNAGTLLLHPDIFGGVSKEQLQGLRVVPFTNVLTFLHNTISSKAFERLSNGKGLGTGFAAIQQQQSKSTTSAARIQAQKKAEAEREQREQMEQKERKKKEEEEAAQQTQQNSMNSLLAMLANQNQGQIMDANDSASGAETMDLLAMLQPQDQGSERGENNELSEMDESNESNWSNWPNKKMRF